MAGSQNRSSSIRGRATALPSHTRGGSRMRESRTYGSVRGACDETHVPTATGRSSLLPVGADRHLPGGAVRWFDARPLRPVRPDYAKHIDDTAERHYTEECQQTEESQAA